MIERLVWNEETKQLDHCTTFDDKLVLVSVGDIKRMDARLQALSAKVSELYDELRNPLRVAEGKHLTVGPWSGKDLDSTSQESEMAELRIVSPTHGADLIGPFEIELEQQVQGGPTQGASFVQFSNSEFGPWTDAQEDGGAIEHDNPDPWTAQSQSWVIPDCNLATTAWLRVQIRDQATGDPILESNSLRLDKVVSQPAPPPHPGASRPPKSG